MDYYFAKKIENTPFGEVIERVKRALKAEGFGVITEIDMRETLKDKLDVDFRKYKILGACNPHYAHQALQAEDKIGTMLPCNVIVQEISPGVIEVAAVNPISSMQAVDNELLHDLANAVTVKLERAVACA